MKIKNYYSISGDGHLVTAKNSVAPNFNALFLSDENLIEYIYIFYEDGGEKIKKTRADFAGGSVKGSYYLRFNCELDTQIDDGLFITAVGLGGENNYISKAVLDSPILKTEKLFICANIFMDITTEYEILSCEFLKLFFNKSLAVKASFDGGTSQTECSLKIDGGGIKIEFETDNLQRNLILSVNNQPSIKIENIFSEEVALPPAEMRNHRIDINRDLALDLSQFTGDIPDFEYEGYGSEIRHIGSINLESAPSGEKDFLSSPDGKFFAVVSGGCVTAYSFDGKDASVIDTFGKYIDVSAAADFVLINRGLVVVYNSGQAALYNFINGEKKLYQKSFSAPKSVQASADGTMLNVVCESYGYLYYSEIDDLQPYSLSGQHYHISPAEDVVYRLFNYQVYCYFYKNNSLNYLYNGINIYYPSVEFKDLSIVYDFIGFNDGDAFYCFNVKSGQSFIMAGENFDNLITTENVKYIMVTYKNQAVRLYYFNKAEMSASALISKDFIIKGSYYFIGDRYILSVNKKAELYEIVQGKKCITFKSADFNRGSVLIKEEKKVKEGRYKVAVSVGSGDV